MFSRGTLRRENGRIARVLSRHGLFHSPCRRRSARSRHRSPRDSRVDRCPRCADRGRGPRARDLPAAPDAAARAHAAGAVAAGARHALRQHDRTGRAAALPGQPRDRIAHLGAGALERARDGGARQPGERRAGRAHRELRVGGGSVRGRLQSFLPRRRSEATSCTSSRTRRRASMRAPSSKGASREDQLDHYRRETGGRACPPIPIRG